MTIEKRLTSLEILANDLRAKWWAAEYDDHSQMLMHQHEAVLLCTRLPKGILDSVWVGLMDRIVVVRWCLLNQPKVDK